MSQRSLQKVAEKGSKSRLKGAVCPPVQLYGRRAGRESGRLAFAGFAARPHSLDRLVSSLSTPPCKRKKRRTELLDRPHLPPPLFASSHSSRLCNVTTSSGYSSLQRHLDSTASYSTLSTSLAASQAAALSSQLATFQSALQTFSSQHRQKILSSPSFRTHFSQLCAELGVDPLGGGSKGLWDKIGVGDWYYALGVQVVDVCLKARERGGGLVSMEEVLREVSKLRGGGGGGGAATSTSKGKKASLLPSAGGSTSEVTEFDIQRAIEALEPLGCGYEIILVGTGKKVVRCAPSAGGSGLDRDSLVVVEAAATTGRGCVTREEVKAFSSSAGGGGGGEWEWERVERALEKALMDDGVVWVDEQAEGNGSLGGKEYWAPGLFVME